jgi:hypothetical protein
MEEMMGFFDMPRTESAEDMLEKFRVRELVEYERFCRDNALWDSMLACFAQDSRVEISWYQGSGQGFVEASKKMKAKAPHKLNNTLVWLNGAHAAGVTMGSIHIRRRIGGTWVDLVSQVRFLYTARKEQGVWKIVTMNCIYEQDSLLPVCAVPPARQPFVRPSYRHLAQVLQEDGFSISEALPGDDQPPAVQALYAQAAAFLAQGAHA